MIRTLFVFCWAAVIAAGSTQQAVATPLFFGPTAYQSQADTPAGFMCSTCLVTLEDFEDDTFADSGLAFDSGQILPPNYHSGMSEPLTDSVDADDGVIDGLGLEGRSYFSSGSELTVTFPQSVPAAGLVWTDGDKALTNVVFEAFDADMNLLGRIDAGDLSDEFYTGQTAEDRFWGVRYAGGIKALRVHNSGGGSGIEIDHIQYQSCACVPEPATVLPASLGWLALLVVRRRK